MIYFRSTLFYLGQAISVVPFVILALLVAFFPPIPRSKAIAGWAHVVTWWLGVTCGLTFTVKGKQNIPSTPCIFASNHSSAWETIATQTFLPPMAWVLKRELFFIPFFGWGLWATRPIAINRKKRKNALEQVIEQGQQKMREGRYILIFPEGTRRAYKDIGEFKKGVAKLAITAKTQIVPIAHNAGKYWSKNSWLIKPGNITCTIGQAIQTNNKTDREVSNEIRDWIIAQNL